jgi:hypothetical protein
MELKLEDETALQSTSFHLEFVSYLIQRLTRYFNAYVLRHAAIVD